MCDINRMCIFKKMYVISTTWLSAMRCNLVHQMDGGVILTRSVFYQQGVYMISTGCAFYQQDDGWV